MIGAPDRMAGIFAGTRARGRAALVMYLVAGDPDMDTTAAVIDAISAAGADLIELGIPYGDPLADGPTIAAAAHRALLGGATVSGTLAVARAAHARGAAPAIFFTYANPVAQFGAERFAAAAAEAGALGAIIPDLPLEELDAFIEPLHAAGLGVPLLIAPTTPRARAAEIVRRTDGFAYVVSRLGVTGARREPDFAWIAETVAALRGDTGKPLAVGFGISTPAHVASVGAVADGVIVGSALVDVIAGKRGAAAADAAGAYVRSLRDALA